MSGLWTILVGNALPAAGLAGVAFLVSSTVRKPALTHLLWILVLVKLVTPPVLPWSIAVSAETAEAIGFASPQTFDPQSTKASQAATALRDQPESMTATPPSVASNTVVSSPKTALESSVATAAVAEAPSGSGLFRGVLNRLRAQWLLVFGLVWATGTVVIGIRNVRLLHCLRCRFGPAERIDADSAQHVGALANKLELPRAPEVGLVDGIVSPLVWGIGPFTRIIFPRTLWEELDTSSRDALLLHELAHYRRGDQWVRLLETIVGCLYWWHPCVWWARRELATAEEECCDAWVVRHAGHQPKNYAEAIITTLDYLAGEPVTRCAIATGVNTMPVLRRRLRHIMHKTVSPVLPQSVRWGFLAAAAMLFPLRPFIHVAPGPAALAASIGTDRLATHRQSLDLVPVSNHLMSDSMMINASVLEELPPSPTGFWTLQIPGQSRSFLFSPDRRFRIELCNGEASAIDVIRTGQRHDLTDDHITCLAFTPDGDRFVAGSVSGEVRLFKAEDGIAASTIGPMGKDRVTSIDVAPDGTWAVSGDETGSVFVWELPSETPRATWTTDSVRINCVRIISDDRILVATGHFTSNLHSGRISILDAVTVEPIAEWPTERIIATIHPDDDTGTGYLLTDYNGDVWGWDGIGDQPAYRGRVRKADIERAEFSPAYSPYASLSRR